MSSSSTTTGTVNVPTLHYKTQTIQQYGGLEGMIKALARELLQNSRDAGAGTIRLHVREDGSWTFEDSGCGMTAEEFVDFYLTLGGTKKATDSVGGFGAAKKVISFRWAKWHAVGQRFRCDGEGVEWTMKQGDGVGRRAGFEVGGDGADLETGQLTAAMRRVYQLSNLPFGGAFVRDVPYLGDDPQGPSSLPDGWTRFLKGRPLLESQVIRRWDWGTLYVVRDPTLNEYESAGRCYVRSRGLYTLDFRLDWQDELWYLELTGASTEILTESRDNLRPQYMDEVKDAAKELREQGLTQAKHVKSLTFFGARKAARRTASEIVEEARRADMYYPPESLTERELELLLRLLDLAEPSELGDGQGIPVTAEQAQSLLDSGLHVRVRSLSWDERDALYEELAAEARAVPPDVADVEDKVKMGDREDKLETARDDAELWSEPVAVAHYSGPAPSLWTDAGEPRPKYSKALEVWKVAVEAVVEATGMARPLLGLIFDPKPENNQQILAAHSEYERYKHLVAVDPEHALTAPPAGPQGDHR